MTTARSLRSTEEQGEQVQDVQIAPECCKIVKKEVVWSNLSFRWDGQVGEFLTVFAVRCLQLALHNQAPKERDSKLGLEGETAEITCYAAGAPNSAGCIGPSSSSAIAEIALHTALLA